MKVLEDKVLEDTFLDLDGLYLKNCKIRNCRVFYSGGEFGWEKTHWENVTIHWKGPAMRTRNLLGHFHMLTDPQKAPDPKSQTVH